MRKSVHKLLSILRLIYRKSVPLILRRAVWCVLAVFLRRKTIPAIPDILQVAEEYLLERCSKRKLLIYGIGETAGDLCKLLTEKHDLNVEYFIDVSPADKQFMKKNVRSFMDIVYEAPDSFFIIIAKDGESYGISRQRFMQLGLLENIDFTYYERSPGIEEALYYDITLSYNRIRGKIEGFEIFGDQDNPEALKIVALGGSTTESSLYYVKGWAQYLTDIIERPVVMYCGGICGYNSFQELVKLLRDVLPLNPDIIISFSGINDLAVLAVPPHCDVEREKRRYLSESQVRYIKDILSIYKSDKARVFYGLENNKKASEMWLDNIRCMHAIAEEYGIIFLSFLQPCWHVGNYKMTDNQKLFFKRRGWHNRPGEDVVHMDRVGPAKNAYSEAQNAIKNFDYISDLTGIFDDAQEVVYLDAGHVTEYGNKIIAENIYSVLINHLNKGAFK